MGWKGRSKWAGRGRRVRRAWGAGRRSSSYGWYRTGDTAIQLSGATQEQHVLIAGGNGLVPTRPVELAVNKAGSVFMERLILKVFFVVTTALAQAAIRYWFGVRLQETQDDGTIATFSATAHPGIRIADSGDRRENWLWRDSLTFVSPATGADVMVLGNSGDDEGHGIRVDFKPKRYLERRMGLVFHHAWEVIGGGAPDMVTQGSRFEADLLLRLPRG